MSQVSAFSRSGRFSTTFATAPSTIRSTGIGALPVSRRHPSVLTRAGQGCTFRREGPEELHMQRPFEGIRIIDITHVLAGPFAAYQLGLMGADVIKVEHPDDPDQSRDSGSDNDLNHANMGTGFLTQASNKQIG